MGGFQARPNGGTITWTGTFRLAAGEIPGSTRSGIALNSGWGALGDLRGGESNLYRLAGARGEGRGGAAVGNGHLEVAVASDEGHKAG